MNCPTCKHPAADFEKVTNISAPVAENKIISILSTEEKKMAPVPTTTRVPPFGNPQPPRAVSTSSTTTAVAACAWLHARA